MEMLLLDKKRVGVKLKAERTRRGILQKQIADQLKVGTTTISNLERGFEGVAAEKYILYAQEFGLAEELCGVIPEEELRERHHLRKLTNIDDLLATNPEKWEQELETLNKEVDFESETKLAPYYHFLKGKIYREKGRKITNRGTSNSSNKTLTKAEDYFLHAIDQINKEHFLVNTNIKSTAYNYLSVISHNRNDFASALFYAEKGIENFVDVGERQYIKYNLLLNKAIYLENLNQNEKARLALKYLNHAIENSTDPRSVRTSVIAQMYLIYSTVLHKLNLTEEALENAFKGIEIALINHDYNKLFMLWSCVGMLYSSLGKLDEAEEYLYNALHINEMVTKEYLRPYNYRLLGSLLVQQKKFDNAKGIIDKSIEISKKYSDELSLTESLSALGRWYVEQALYQDAIDILNKAKDLEQKHHFLHLEKEILTSLCECYEQANPEELKNHALDLYFIIKQGRGLSAT
jgi:tetratricopeptide (TPR) repeat protein